MLKLARDLGSEGNILGETQSLVFRSEEEARAFQDFCKAQGVPVSLAEQSGAEGVPAFVVSAKKPEPPTPPEKPTGEAETGKEPGPETVKERFERVLKGNFARVARGTFPPPRPPFTSILISPVPGESGRLALNATFFYKNENGDDRRASWSVFEDGVVGGRIPKDITLSREEILDAVLSAVEAEHMKRWYQTVLDIIPEGDEGEPRGEQEEAREKTGARPPNDPKRIEALEKLPGFKFGFVNKERGFDGYRGALITGRKTVVVIDCEFIGNAGFVVPISAARVGEMSELLAEKSEALTEERVNRILASVWEPITQKAKTRSQLLAQVPDARRIVHLGEWQKKIREAVEQLSN